MANGIEMTHITSLKDMYTDTDHKFIIINVALWQCDSWVWYDTISNSR